MISDRRRRDFTGKTRHAVHSSVIELDMHGRMGCQTFEGCRSNLLVTGQCVLLHQRKNVRCSFGK
ncbi:hypothetical protein KCP78_23160 [Salmonella enterica subsp. enterica]|nr:hypothetical protein KCP78_23160 [Salmonella enterica subsp. enterica]